MLRVNNIRLDLEGVFFLSQVVDPIELVVADTTPSLVVSRTIAAEEATTIPHHDSDPCVANIAFELFVLRDLRSLLFCSDIVAWPIPILAFDALVRPRPALTFVCGLLSRLRLHGLQAKAHLLSS